VVRWTCNASFPIPAFFIRKTRYPAFIEIDHVHHAVDHPDHLRMAHVGQRFGEEFAAHFSLSLMSDFSVPFHGVEVVREAFAEQAIKFDFVVTSSFDRGQHLLRVDAEVHRQESVKAAAEIFLIGLRQITSQVLTAFADKAWQVQQSTGVRFEGRRQVETYFTSWAEVLISHDLANESA